MDELTPKRCENAMQLGHELGTRTAEHVLNGANEAVHIVMIKRQRQIDLCRKKWGEDVAKAYNKGFVLGLYEYAVKFAGEKSIPVSDAEEIISRWCTEVTAQQTN